MQEENLLLGADFRALLLFMAKKISPCNGFLEPLFTFILILRLEECRYMRWAIYCLAKLSTLRPSGVF
jgi:hypothetical protein